MRISTVAYLAACLALTGGLASSAIAKPWWMRGIESKETDFLPPDAAFRVSARTEGNVMRVRWGIADKYYLYRQKIDIKAESPDLNVAAPVLPKGTLKNDAYFGTQEIYRQQVEARWASPSSGEASPSSWQACCCARNASSTCPPHEQAVAAHHRRRTAGGAGHLGGSMAPFV